MRVLVTGASGFIGAELCRQLRERSHEVHALVRRAGSQPPGTVAVTGDLRDAEHLRLALGSASPECVFHLAAEIASQRSAAKVREVNVHGTERLIAACVQLPSPPRIVFASTVVTGEAHGRLLEEDSTLAVQTPYGHSKQEGERLLGASGLQTVIVRPSHVYGAGGWYANEIVRRLLSPGRLAVIGRGENLWDVVHVHDVASALVLACEQAPSGSLYHVCDDTPLSAYEFVALTAKTLGVGPPRRVPVALARMIAGSAAVAAVVRSARSSNARIKRELGWQPRFESATVGVPEAIDRLRAAGGPAVSRRAAPARS